jgi:hypothetical protein
LTEKLGGEAAVRAQFMDKGKEHGKGKTREFEQLKAEARDTEVTPDSVLETYIRDKNVSLPEARRKTATLEERRVVEELSKRVVGLERELRRFRVDLAAAPNLPELRRALAKLARCRVWQEPSPVDGKHRTDALWAPDADAFLCDVHAMAGSHRFDPGTLHRPFAGLLLQPSLTPFRACPRLVHASDRRPRPATT